MHDNVGPSFGDHAVLAACINTSLTISRLRGRPALPIPCLWW
ncbi:hypothetical protein M3J09_000815 [Ascochyta lentis]